MYFVDSGQVSATAQPQMPFKNVVAKMLTAESPPRLRL